MNLMKVTLKRRKGVLRMRNIDFALLILNIKITVALNSGETHFYQHNKFYFLNINIIDFVNVRTVSIAFYYDKSLKFALTKEIESM